jgi:DNA repair protein RadC
MVRLPAATLRLPREELLPALLHAMVHWINAQQGIADCNHSGYHNQKFKRLAEAVGFAVGDRLPKTGWTDLQPTPDLLQALADFPLRLDPLRRLADLLPDRSPSPRIHCRPNLPIGLAASPYWRTAETVLPKLPRYRLQLLHEAQQPIETYPKLETTADAAALFWQILHTFDREAVAVLFLDTRRRVLGYDIPYIGILNRANVEPRGILTPALLMNAAAVAVAHNHPSGDATPSREDEVFTRRVVEAGKVLGIEVVGSVVVGGRGLWRKVGPSRC